MFDGDFTAVKLGLLLLLVTTQSVWGQLEWEKVDPAGSPPDPRFMPADAMFGDRWTITGGDKHATEGEPSFVYEDLWDYDFVNNRWIDRTGEIEGTVPGKSWRQVLYRSNGVFMMWGGKSADTDTIYYIAQDGNKWLEEHAPFPAGYVAGYTWITFGIFPEFLYVFGGTDDYETSGYAKTYRHHIGSETPWVELNAPWANGKPPPARYFHTSVYRALDNSWYIYGGTNNVFVGEPYSDIWKFSLNEEVWEEVIPNGTCIPQARSLHASAITPDGMGFFIYGGVHSGVSSLSDLWMFHFNTKRWIEIKTTGWTENAHRDGHVMTIWLDPRTNVPWIYLFGGDETEDSPVQFNDLYRLPLADLGCTAASVDTCKHVDNSCTHEDPAAESKKKTVFAVILVVTGAAVLCAAILIGFYLQKKKESAAEAVNK